MKIHYSLTMLLAFILAGCDKSESPVCSDINKVIDQNIKMISLNHLEGRMYDKSAIQQSARESVTQKRISVINLNLSLMRDHGCKPRNRPIYPENYTQSALKCYQDGGKIQSQSDNLNKTQIDAIKKVCDFKNWKKDSFGY